MDGAAQVRHLNGWANKFLGLISIHENELPKSQRYSASSDVFAGAFWYWGSWSGGLRLRGFSLDAGQSLWQVLPLGPTGYGDSPYACYSAFAGNTLLISPDQLVSDGLLTD